MSRASFNYLDISIYIEGEDMDLSQLNFEAAPRFNSLRHGAGPRSDRFNISYSLIDTLLQEKESKHFSDDQDAYEIVKASLPRMSNSRESDKSRW